MNRRRAHCSPPILFLSLYYYKKRFNYFVVTKYNSIFVPEQKEDKSEICVVQSISVGESPFFLLYIELAASSRRPLRISST